MNRADLSALLRENPYPGRGILLGRSPDGGCAVAAYFIMGRSENSRNRVFAETDDGIRTLAFDPAKVTDPSLIIYHPVRVVGGTTVVTNGDQTDTVADALRRGGDWAEALRTRAYEPDAPNFTPRISGLLTAAGDYRLSILKASGRDGGPCRRFFFEYEQPAAGQGHLIHTYAGDGDPLPSFAGEPVLVALDTPDAAALARLLWTSLNAENKVSLFVRCRHLQSGQIETVIINKHGKEGTI